MFHLTRAARGAAIALALGLVVAAPAAAAQPTRNMRPLHGGFVYPAGQACAFDVAGQPNAKPTAEAAFQSGGFVVETDFSDGLVTYSVRARGAYVNVETGARFGNGARPAVLTPCAPARCINQLAGLISPNASQKKPARP